ncbi:MAG: lipase maturation factor family protein [Verrucomicrobia bacterium]|nr:lipase maturation factor family protein [Verrucomicrobiota bacterium]
MTPPPAGTPAAACPATDPTRRAPAPARLAAACWTGLKNFAALSGDTSYLWIRWLILRGVGLVFLIVFTGLLKEGQALIGPAGLAPLGDFFTRLTQEVPQPLAAFWRAPGLFWINSGAGMITAVAWLGWLAAAALLLNLWPRLMLFVCWLTFLSFVTTLRVFSQTQVDQLMLETALLCLPFAPAGWRPGLGADRPPRPITVLMLRLFLLRIMLEAGCMKLFLGDAHWRDFTAMDALYETTPFPTILGYFDFQLPHWWHVGEWALTFVAEIVAPLVAVFGGRRARWVAFVAWVMLQTGIQLTNSFGWLNTTSVALGLILLDDTLLAGVARMLRLRRLAGWLETRAIRRSAPAVPAWKLYGLRVLLWGQLILALHVFGVNFCGFPTDDFFSRRVSPLYVRFQSANSYSLYAALVPKRMLVEFEGSNDGGKTWRPYEFRYQAQREDQIPGFIAPYYARFEATLQGETLNETASTLYEVVAAKLIEREPGVMKLFRADPFPDHRPGLIRLPVSQLKFTDLVAYRATGRYWRKETLGTYQPAIYLTAEGKAARAETPLDELRVMAAQGNAEAQAGLGELYFSGGEDVKSDPVQAVGWLRQAAQQGQPRAQFLLGLCYANGRGLAKNVGEAARWYRLAALQGDGFAQINLGFLYGAGEGVARDEIEALGWLNVAATSDAPDAAKIRDGAERGATPTAVLAGRQRAQALQAEIAANKRGAH